LVSQYIFGGRLPCYFNLGSDNNDIYTIVILMNSTLTPFLDLVNIIVLMQVLEHRNKYVSTLPKPDRPPSYLRGEVAPAYSVNDEPVVMSQTPPTYTTAPAAGPYGGQPGYPAYPQYQQQQAGWVQPQQGQQGHYESDGYSKA
jgi:hypothetical protein